MGEEKNKASAKLTKWEFFSRLMVVLQAIIMFVGFYFTAKQIIELRYIKNDRSADFMLIFDEKITSGTNGKILAAVENNMPILVNNRGQFNTSELDNFLGVFELLNNIYEKKLIDDEMLYNAFSYGVIKSFNNSEIRGYLAEIRKEDPTFFMGFEILALNLLKEN